VQRYTAALVSDLPPWQIESVVKRNLQKHRIAIATPRPRYDLKEVTSGGGYRQRATSSEMVAIANVGLDDRPAAVELAVRLCRRRQQLRQPPNQASAPLSEAV
jgi:hypothetical protein